MSGLLTQIWSVRVGPGGYIPSGVRLAVNPSGPAKNGQMFQKHPSEKRQGTVRQPSEELQGQEVLRRIPIDSIGMRLGAGKVCVRPPLPLSPHRGTVTPSQPA